MATPPPNERPPKRPKVWAPRGWVADPEVVARTPDWMPEDPVKARLHYNLSHYQEYKAHEIARAAKAEKQRHLGRGMRAVAKALRAELGLGPEANVMKDFGEYDPRFMTDAQLQDVADALMRAQRYDWAYNARPEQRMPPEFEIWLILAGRGFGKTRAGSEAVREVCEQPNRRVAVFAKDHRQLRDVVFSGVSGLIACIPPEQVKDYRRGLGDVSITLVNGSKIFGYTAGEPDAVRGQSFDFILGDEFAAWPKNAAQDMLDQAQMCLRESDDARMVLCTTPKRVEHVLKMIKRATEEPGIVVTRGRMADNTALSEKAKAMLYRQHAGTRLGRQELEGELVLDLDNALFTGAMIEAAIWTPKYNEKTDEYEKMPPMVGVFTGVDPSGSNDGDATGIVTIGWDKDKILWVLDNATCGGSPAERYSAACLSAFKHGTTEIWYESAYGGDNVAYGITERWKDLVREGVIPPEARCPWVRPSTIKGDKAHRAGPIVAIMEQQANLPEFRNLWILEPTVENNLLRLNDELLSWETDSKKSPNALDGFVHCSRQIRMRLGFEASVGKAHSSRKLRRRPGDPTGRATVYDPFKKAG